MTTWMIAYDGLKGQCNTRMHFHAVWVDMAFRFMAEGITRFSLWIWHGDDGSLVGLFHFWSSMSTWSTLDKGKRSFVSYPYRTTIRTVQHVNIQVGRKRQSCTEGRRRLRQPCIIIGAQAEMNSRSIVAILGTSRCLYL